MIIKGVGHVLLHVMVWCTLTVRTVAGPLRVLLRALVVVLWLGGSASTLALGSGSADEVRAFILLRLAGQIYWSSSSGLGDPTAAYRLCIYRNPDFFNEVQALVRDRQLAEGAVELVQAQRLDQLTGCHIADVGDVSPDEVERIVSTGMLQSTVFVASSDQSARTGLHIRLYLGESNTFDVEINRAAFALGGNEPSASFLKLAGKVYDSLGSDGVGQ